VGNSLSPSKPDARMTAPHMMWILAAAFRTLPVHAGVTSAVRVDDTGGPLSLAEPIFFLFAVVFLYAFLMRYQGKLNRRQREQRLISEPASFPLPPLPVTNVSCEYCGTEQPRNEACVNCGRSLPKDEVDIQSPHEQPGMAVRYHPSSPGSSFPANNKNPNESAAYLRSYSRSHWKMAFPVAMTIYGLSIPLVSYGASDYSLVDFLILGLVGVFFGGPIALAYGIAWFFQARNDDTIFPKVMGASMIILVVASIMVFLVVSYATLDCNNPSAYWWNWRDFYDKCGFYPPTN
jgi:hypothetical protein